MSEHIFMLVQWAGPPFLTFAAGFLVVQAIIFFLSLIGSDQDLYLYLKVLAFTGALGGVILGLMLNDGKIRWVWSDPKDRFLLHLGLVGDALVGVGGAWGIFMVLGRSLKLGKDSDSMIALVGLGVVAGFGARSLLQMLRRRLERAIEETKEIAVSAKQTAQQTAQQTAEDISSITQYTSSNIASIAADIFDAASGEKGRFRDLLTRAEKLAQEGINQTPRKPSAYRDLALIKKRLALISQDSQARANLLSEAIAAATKAIELDPKLEWAYYNRACYRVFLATQGVRNNELLREGLADLGHAIQLDESNKATAWADPDFNILRQENNPDFYRLVGRQL